MDIFEKYGIKIPNSVLIEGVTKTETDDEVVQFLEKYGTISKSQVIEETDSVFNRKWIVEFSSGAAIVALNDILPYTFVSDDAQVTYEISELSTVCAAQVEKLKTNAYLSELKDLAKHTGKNFTDVLNDVMSLLGHSVKQLSSAPQDSLPPAESSSNFSVTVENPSQASDPSGQRVSFSTRASFPSVTASDLQPPEVQRYVVEHIVKNEDSAMLHLTSQRLRAFSGRLPRPQNETDYETWRSTVDLLLNDPSVSDLQRSRKIFESLLPPAADMVKHLKPETRPAVYIQILDSAYGTVQDGDELYAKFMDTFQDAGEKPSSYLQRLQVALSLAVKRGGVPHTETDKHLLNQFCRGCWDNTLISELQLKQRKHNPPSFAELLLLLRTEEDRDAAKNLRMKQHLGSSKAKAMSQAQYAYAGGEDHEATTLEKLTKQLADIQRQLAALTAAQSSQRQPPVKAAHPGSGAKSTKTPSRSSRPAPSGPKPGYCYQCGEDGHIKPACDNPPNPALVTLKKKQHAEKLQKWQKSNSSSGRSLN